jgi:hypothetical protein
MAYEYDRFDDESSGGGAFLMGLIAGAVLGAGLGMLLAPKPGSELRSQLGDTASRLRERAAEGYGRVSEMYSRRAGATGGTGSVGTEGGFQSGGSYAGGTAGTSGYATGGTDTPATNPEF